MAASLKSSHKRSDLLWLRRLLPLILSISIIFNLILAAKNFFPGLFSKQTSLAERESRRATTDNTATVSRIIDGDTFDLTDKRRIRLLEIDAPEYPKGCLAQQAKDRLTELILGKQVVIKNPTPDNFQRLVASVSVGNLDIAGALISEGFAIVTTTDDPALLLAQDEAQAARRGIWSDKCQKPADPKCVIKGNVRRDRGTKIFHRSDCYNYEKIVVSERDGDQWFCSPAEARAAGFTKSSDCPD